ncbi:MAG: hypothetical protein GY847_37515 [Proteobacteria bacterium]|nr:hypothetical protein [Pseudomonadota bacterium]
MYRLTFTVVVVIWSAAACTPGVRASPQNPGRVETPEKDENMRRRKTARALEKMGNHLEASIYFEAALAQGGDEQEILPSLIASQIRAGRLRAAKRNVVRLQEIEHNPAHVEELEELVRLLDRFAPREPDRSSVEVEQ